MEILGLKLEERHVLLLLLMAFVGFHVWHAWNMVFFIVLALHGGVVIDRVGHTLFNRTQRIKPLTYPVIQAVLKTLCYMLPLLGLVIIGTFFTLLYVPALLGLYQKLPEQWVSGWTWVTDKIDALDLLATNYNLSISVKESFSEQLDNLGQNAPQIIQSVVGSLLQLTGGVVQLIGLMLLSTLIAFMLRSNEQGCRKFVAVCFAPKTAEYLSRVAKLYVDKLLGFFYSVGVLGSILFVVYLTFLSFVPNQFDWGTRVALSFVCGTLSAFPGIGGTLSFAVGLVAGVLTLGANIENTWWPVMELPGYKIVLLPALAYIINTLEGTVISPKILGDKIGVKPIWIIVTTLASLAAGGFAGLTLGLWGLFLIASVYEVGRAKAQGYNTPEMKLSTTVRFTLS